MTHEEIRRRLVEAGLTKDDADDCIELIVEECVKAVEAVDMYEEDDPGETFAAAIRERFKETP